jgi:uncharacterized protein (DUF1697 family)
MPELRSALAEAGLANVRTLLQSGNVVFDAAGKSPSGLESLLGAEVEARLGLAIEFLVRSAAEWRAILDANPLVEEARSDPSRLVVLFLRHAPPAASVKRLQEWTPGRETLRAAGRELFIHYPDGQGRSRLTNAVLERGLGGPATARNWNTVLRLEDELRRV